MVWPIADHELSHFEMLHMPTAVITGIVVSRLIWVRCQSEEENDDPLLFTL